MLSFEPSSLEEALKGHKLYVYQIISRMLRNTSAILDINMITIDQTFRELGNETYYKTVEIANKIRENLGKDLEKLFDKYTDTESHSHYAFMFVMTAWTSTLLQSFAEKLEKEISEEILKNGGIETESD